MPTVRGVVADAARAVDPGLASRVEGCEQWRTGYAEILHALTRASARSSEDSLHIARAGLASANARMRLDDVALADAERLPASCLQAETVIGTTEPVRELMVPYRGRMLRGEELAAQLDDWVARCVVEPSFADAIRMVLDHPEWLRLPGRQAVLVGAAAEMSPLEPLVSWGASVVAIDVPVKALQERIRATAEAGAGEVTVPTDGLATGADLVRQAPALGAWLRERRETHGSATSFVLGMYAYADRGLHVRLSMAFDLLARWAASDDADTALAYLATPADAFVVPPEVVAAAHQAWAGRRVRRILQAPLRAGSAGRLFAPSYPATYEGGRGVADILVTQQGPNYAVAKRLQRWRGLAAHADGHRVSLNVAPATWTRSVTRNRVLAAAYAGAPAFGIEVFEPATSRALMAALLVHDLYAVRPVDDEPEGLISSAAAHGGLWRAAYEPRSALGIAAAIGIVRPPRRSSS